MSVALEGLNKRFGPLTVIDRLSVNFAQGAISVLLGPSGCGKTTTLRCIAGLEQPDSGRISVGGADVFWSERRINLPPERRNLGMVFQSYAIWPHMTVVENVRLPLRARGVVAEDGEEARRVGAGNRGPRRASDSAAPRSCREDSSSGWRCALHRQRSPVILLDEPLSNLDARLRSPCAGSCATCSGASAQR